MIDCCGECYISEPGKTPVSTCGCPDQCGMDGCNFTGEVIEDDETEAERRFADQKITP